MLELELVLVTISKGCSAATGPEDVGPEVEETVAEEAGAREGAEDVTPLDIASPHLTALDHTWRRSTTLENTRQHLTVAEDKMREETNELTEVGNSGPIEAFAS